jgi:hypothetical protein
MKGTLGAFNQMMAQGVIGAYVIGWVVGGML